MVDEGRARGGICANNNCVVHIWKRVYEYKVSVNGDACITVHLGGGWHQSEVVQQRDDIVQHEVMSYNEVAAYNNPTRAGVQRGTKPVRE